VPTTGTGYAYYTSAKDYVGSDSFTWRVNDGLGRFPTWPRPLSSVGVVLPALQNQTVAVRKDTATDIPAAYTGGGGYTYSAVIVSGG